LLLTLLKHHTCTGSITSTTSTTSSSTANVKAF
jgi:hypothetical protein